MPNALFHVWIPNALFHKAELVEKLADEVNMSLNYFSDSGWDMAPYIEAIDSQQSSCFILKFFCDLLCIRRESTGSRTEGRALEMMDKLVEGISNSSPGVTQNDSDAPGAVKWLRCGTINQNDELNCGLLTCDTFSRCSLGDVTNNDACYEKALEFSNDKSARAKARDVEKALDGFARAVQLDPDNGEAWNNIACLYALFFVIMAFHPLALYSLIWCQSSSSSICKNGYAEPPESASSSDWTPAHQQQYKENIQRNATALRYIQQGVNSDGVQDFCSRVTEIVNQIKGCEDSIEDKKVNEKVLRCLPPKFDHVAAAIEESRDLSKMTFSDLSRSLRSHEQRINRPSSQPTEQAFQSKINNSNQNKSSKKDQKNRGSSQRNGQRGKGKREQNDNCNKWKNDRGNSQQNSDSQCIICNRSNHESKDCRYKCTRCRIPNHSQRDCWYQNKKGKNEANFTKEGDGDYLFYSSKGAERESYNLWYLDSGCSNHMTGERDIFISLDQSFNSQVKLGDGKMQKVVGKGTIAVHTKGGNKKLISDVLYVPNLTQNLLSVEQLIQKGFSIYFDDEKCKIIDKTNNHTVAVVEMSKNKVFPLVMPLDENVALKTENSDLSNLWHLRYGHLNYKGLNLLKQKNMVIGLPDVGRYEKVCEGCIYGKMHRLPFPKNSWRAKAPLELVHADICGPTRTLSLNNRRYFILFVDDYTRMMWIYLLNEKAEAFSIFLQFKALAERQSGWKMKTLRIDRGGEFIYTPLMNYCRDNGIQRQLTISRSPQQNGVAEWKNRTIVEMARSMLKGKDIPNNLWAEACHTAVYILNRSPTKAIRDKTPFEAWHNRKPTVDHLKIFGSIAYEKIIEEICISFSYFLQ
ncbi:hypothetical protein KPL70_012460 [Citrus sinensis]|nr:hypothetical protein KPL70_012460 [Citrus sinensis]